MTPASVIPSAVSCTDASYSLKRQPVRQGVQDIRDPNPHVPDAGPATAQTRVEDDAIGSFRHGRHSQPQTNAGSSTIIRVRANDFKLTARKSPPGLPSAPFAWWRRDGYAGWCRLHAIGKLSRSRQSRLIYTLILYIHGYRIEN